MQQKSNQNSKRSTVRSYLASLLDGERHKLGTAYNLVQLPLVFAIMSIMLSMVFDPLPKLSSLLYSTSNTILHYSPHPFLNDTLLMPLVYFITQLLARPHIDRLVVDSQEQWNELKSLPPYLRIQYGKVILNTLCVVCLILAAFNVNSYYMINKRDIRVNHLFAKQGNTYDFTKISSIKQEPYKQHNNSTKVEYWIYNIDFRDESTITLSGQSMFKRDQQRLDSAIQYISQQSKIPITN